MPLDTFVCPNEVVSLATIDGPCSGSGSCPAPLGQTCSGHGACECGCVQLCRLNARSAFLCGYPTACLGGRLTSVLHTMTESVPASPAGRVLQTVPLKLLWIHLLFNARTTLCWLSESKFPLGCLAM